MFYFQAVTIFSSRPTHFCLEEVFILYQSFEFFRVKYAGGWTQTIDSTLTILFTIWKKMCVHKLNTVHGFEKCYIIKTAAQTKHSRQLGFFYCPYVNSKCGLDHMLNRLCVAIMTQKFSTFKSWLSLATSEGFLLLLQRVVVRGW